MLFNHFNLQDGVCRSALSFANILAKRNDAEITLIPLFRYHKTTLEFLDSKVKVKPIFRFYFQGMSSLVKRVPAKLLYRYIIGDRYDVNIAFQFGTSQITVSSGKSSKHLSIGWMHGYDTKMLLKKYYLKMDKMVSVSKCGAERLAIDLDNKITVDYCYNPIDDEYIRKQGKESIEYEKNTNLQLITVGRMSKEKGIDRLLQCVRRLKDDGYHFSLWIVGDGPQLNILKKIANELDIDDIVIFIGCKNNPHAYTSKSDLFICSSYSEGYSTACTEAIMLNVPVISTNVSGANEIIQEAGCGEVVDSTEDGIYNGIKKILDHPNLLKEWKDILKSTKYKFSPQQRFKKFENIIGL